MKPKESQTRIDKLERAFLSVMESRRHRLLQELGSIEKTLGTKPTTAEIRTWWRQVNRA